MMLIQNPNSALYTFPKVKELLEKKAFCGKRTDFSLLHPHFNSMNHGVDTTRVSVCQQNAPWEEILNTVPSALSWDSQRIIFNLIYKCCFLFFVMTDTEVFSCYMPLKLFLMFIILQVFKFQAFNIHWNETDQTYSCCVKSYFCIFSLDGCNYWEDRERKFYIDFFWESYISCDKHYSIFKHVKRVFPDRVNFQEYLSGFA